MTGWTAEFRGGPTPPHDRHVSAGDFWERVWFARVDPSEHPSPATIDGWALIGFKPGPGAPGVPWVEQAEYELDEDATVAHERGDHAVYRYVEPGTVLTQYTIYDHPTDFPDSFVVRRWFIRRGEPHPVPDPHVFATVDTLDEARSFIPEGLHRIPRSPGDDEKIAETWT